MPISEIAGVLTSFNALKNIVQSMIDLRDAQAIQLKVLEFNGTLIDAQSKILLVQEERTALIDRVRDLEKQIADLEAWETEKQRYELKEIAGGSFARVVKPSMQGSEPPHQICEKCYQARKKSILQRKAGSTASAALGRPNMLFCPECKTEVVG